MVLLQPRLNLKVTQKQILTPGLVQMVSVLALNKLELRDMINAEMVENPVLEELDSSVPLLDEVSQREEDREHPKPADEPIIAQEKKDPFEEIDFGQFFQEYLDPGYRTSEGESIEKPSFENFISRPSTLTDHLMWQLGSLHVSPEVYEAAELIIGNLNEDGYLIASEDELLGAAVSEMRPGVANPEEVPAEPAADVAVASEPADDTIAFSDEIAEAPTELAAYAAEDPALTSDVSVLTSLDGEAVEPVLEEPQEAAPSHGIMAVPRPPASPHLTREILREAIALVQQLDPIGVGARDLRECLLAQLNHLQQMHSQKANGNGTGEVLKDAIAIVSDQLRPLQNKQYREIGKAINRPLEAVMAAFDFIKTLDPKPGLRYNKVAPRLIEPDVAFIKQGDEYLVVMNDEDVPQLRLNPTYKRLLSRDAAEKDVRNYVKERYKSAIQLIKNIEQRKQTILKVCYAIIGRQREFLDFGIDQLKPMMIKEVAEEIGVHPSTVSRAVANKYAHTSQGVFELRYFFSESVNGPEGGNTSLLILKRRVKKLIDEEDPTRPLTDEQITRILQSQGIQVTRRTVAKYREDMRIPSTHQRRQKK